MSIYSIMVFFAQASATDVATNSVGCVMLQVSAEKHRSMQSHSFAEHDAVHAMMKDRTALAVSKPNLVFIKTPKTGGSTFGGVIRRIGERFGYAHTHDSKSWLESQMKDEQPFVLANHGHRATFDAILDKRGFKDNVFLTMLRSPAERCLAAYYHFRVSRRGADPNSTERKLAELKDCAASPIAKQIATGNSANTPIGVTERLESYDFIGVTERFDESLLVLRRQLDLSLVDILYLKSKDSTEGGVDERGFVMFPHPPLFEEPAEVQHAAEQLNTTLDSQLFASANSNLDEAIAAFGPGFAQELEQFQGMLAVVEAKCRAHFWESCLWGDEGCGQVCIDELSRSRGWS